MDIYEIAHALRDIQDAHRALDQEITALRDRITAINGNPGNDERRARLAEHIAKHGNRPMITLEVK